jgi:hypothetical protein
MRMSFEAGSKNRNETKCNTWFHSMSNVRMSIVVVVVVLIVIEKLNQDYHAAAGTSVLNVSWNIPSESIHRYRISGTLQHG